MKTEMAQQLFVEFSGIKLNHRSVRLFHAYGQTEKREGDFNRRARVVNKPKN
jgi:hypothetical protein